MFLEQNNFDTYNKLNAKRVEPCQVWGDIYVNSYEAEVPHDLELDVSPINVTEIWVLGETPAFQRKYLNGQNLKFMMALNKFHMGKKNQIWLRTQILLTEIDFDEAPEFQMNG